MSPPIIPARDVARMLAGRAEALARELQPQGKREGREWVSPSLTGTARHATSICINGAKAGLWADFSANATVRGDALDFVAHVLFAGRKSDAYAWALRWLGLPAVGSAPSPVHRPQPSPPRAPSPDGHERATAARAFALFMGGQAELRGTPAAAYLAKRGLDLAQLGRQPRSLRYHPACRCTEVAADLPAMLAAICGPDGKHIATHRTWLAEIEGTWRKAPLRAPKKVIGRYTGGSIRLWRGASGKPLATMPETDTVVIAEGIENALAAALACPEFRVLAAVSLSNLGRIILPAQAIDVIIAADNDYGNPAAEAALQRAVDRLMTEGRSVRVARSSVGKDLADGISAA